MRRLYKGLTGQSHASPAPPGPGPRRIASVIPRRWRLREADDKSTTWRKAPPPAPAGRSLRRWLPLLVIILLVALFFLFGLQRYVSLASLRANHEWLARRWRRIWPLPCSPLS